jgi:hypothetical protein
MTGTRPRVRHVFPFLLSAAAGNLPRSFSQEPDSAGFSSLPGSQK